MKLLSFSDSEEANTLMRGAGDRGHGRVVGNDLHMQ